ncbi:HD domain-containing protein [Dyadobacter arcticus]|uniref:HD superfamily phosphodiesterase n=1 Tax=Dyadobacter arcticus TaxID=1078754 RepID=A0ABX0UQW7_9BACT|nr:HD domain-containing protein [Dyadobacter arcticus]NIJ54070.1 HD superfamily phosphodiesterase [Dyadobacter arcticus]
MQIEQVQSYILEELRSRLDSNLYYHGVHHTLDVVQTALELAALEAVTDQESLCLIKTAALFHDCGFMNTYKGHEDESCRIAKEVLPDFDYSPEEISTICGMIMATRIPQDPQTHLERIISDADLDYLGRDDFEPIAATLFEELKAREIVTDVNVWNQIQIRFIGDHFYWTKSERARRNELKTKHLAALRQ